VQVMNWFGKIKYLILFVEEIRHIKWTRVWIVYKYLWNEEMRQICCEMSVLFRRKIKYKIILRQLLDYVKEWYKY